MEVKRVRVSRFFFLLALGAGVTAACTSSDDATPTTTPDASVDAPSSGSSGSLSDVDIPDSSDETTPEPPCDPGDAPLPPDTDKQPKLTISAVGMFTNAAKRELAPGVRAFTPRFALWSDGAKKERFIYLPPCSKLDTSDPDMWELPVGGKFFKNFSREGKLAETRIIHRWGPGPTDYTFAPYLWRDDDTDADYVPNGVTNARGTPHDIPSVSDCKNCHQYRKGKMLGFAAIQLQHNLPDSLNLQTLIAEHRLSKPVPIPTVPGNPVESEAIGYLHANCSHCHNPDGVPFINPFDLSVHVGDDTLAKTGAYRTAVKVPTEKFVTHPEVKFRVAPGQPDTSCLIYRMSTRGGITQMPPLATEDVDTVGVQKVHDWISGLQ